MIFRRKKTRDEGGQKIILEKIFKLDLIIFIKF